LLAVEASLWTFASVPGVEPTNNAAERALRHAVYWRKTSLGTDSEGGSRFVERMLWWRRYVGNNGGASSTPSSKP
jgi:transposase